MPNAIAPKDLSTGVYWYVKPGAPAVICEKRENEEFVRFTNCSRQSWIRPGEGFVGPLVAPTE